MSRFIKKSSKKAGLQPGSLIHVGDRKEEKTRIRVFDYDSERLEEKECQTVEETFPYRDKESVSWINIDGLHEIQVIEKVGEQFNLHPLLLEDILNTGQRPKIEDYGDYVFVVLKMLYYDEEEIDIRAEQLSLVFNRNAVISFQERVGDVFEPVRKRIRDGRGRIRASGTDYLAYALMDAVVDNYFIVLEKIGEDIEELEEEIIVDPNEELLHKIHELKREMVFLRKSVWPLREVVSRLERAESQLVQKTTSLYLRDLYDHTIQVIDTIESFRDLLAGILDIYLSSTSNRMNEVMKVLTIMATIFIPLTFIAGVYGMNFDYMPELHKSWGYPMALLLMVIIAVIMVIYFRKKDWL